MAAPRKILCVGFQKTGTTSLSAALKQLGINVGYAAAEINARADWQSADQEETIWRILREVVARTDGIQDSPAAFFHDRLDRAFPRSKFILTVRDPKSWLASYRTYFTPTNNPLRRWMYGVDTVVGNDRLYLEIYRRRNEEIRAYFADRPGDLLVMDLQAGDGWLKLVNFLGDDFLPRFPHENRRRGG